MLRAPARLRPLLVGTDVAFLLYWFVTALMALGFVHLPPEYLYAGYDDPVMVAWNWSFMPLDVAFSLTGLAALRLEQRGGARWAALALVSLSLTVCAGMMAIAFWAIRGDFDPAWWAVNLCILIWPLPYMLRLVQMSGAAAISPAASPDAPPAA